MKIILVVGVSCVICNTENNYPINRNILILSFLVYNSCMWFGKYASKMQNLKKC